VDEANLIPVLHRHFRLQWEPAQDCHVLLYPEGMIKLNGSAGEIMTCIDGQSSVTAIIQTLQDRFPDADGIAADTLEFLKIANEKRWIELR
jgi:pyrroloquinoline quinone biosynthesis protein D